MRSLIAACAWATLLSGQTVIKPDPLEYTPAEVADQQNYRQPLRPQFHYTPIQGTLITVQH